MKKLLTLTVLSLIAVLILLPIGSFFNHLGDNLDPKNPTLLSDGNPFPPLPPLPPTLVADGNPFPPLPPPPGNAFMNA